MTEKLKIKDRLITLLVKGIPFGGVMVIYDFIKDGEISWLKFGILSFLFGLIMSFTDPIKDFKLKSLFASKSDFLRLSVFIILSLLIAVALKLAIEINAFAELLLAAILLFIGSYRNKTVPNIK